MRRIKELRQLNIDNWLIILSICYIIFPIILFCIGWLKPYYGIPLGLGLIYLGYCIAKKFIEDKQYDLIIPKSIGFWAIVVGIVTIWVYLSGIGCFVWQNEDFIGRNSTFRDLCNLEWPILINLSKESEIVQSVCGDATVGYSYYFTWWLPVAFLSKVLRLNELWRNIFLFDYAITGVFLTVYLLMRKFNKCSYYVVVLLIFFSGLDVIPQYLLYDYVGTMEHIEWWAQIFQYSSNTTQLFWVFNQVIPIWIITSLILQDDNVSVIALTAISFAYSPWGTIGLIPIALYLSYKGKIKKSINIENIILPIIILLVFGTYYTSGTGYNGEIGLTFNIAQVEWRSGFMTYLVFILVECLLYFIVMGKSVMKYDLYVIVFIELLLIPLVIIRDYNFIMRASIPALFVLMTFIIRFLIEEDKKNIRYKLLLLFLLIGSLTPIHEINRTVLNTMQKTELEQDALYSYADMQVTDTDYIGLVKNQFFIYDYQDTFFYKYLADL